MEIGMVNLKNMTIIIQQEKRVTIMNSTVKTTCNNHEQYGQNNV